MRIARLAAIIAWSVPGVLLCLAPAVAEKRVALVVGNAAYKNASKLANPTNDAKAISGMLQSAGFDAVELHENLGIRELRQAINDFADLARDADTAVVYYSGHGMEVNGINYLIPIDAVLNRDTDVPYETVSLDNLVQVMEPSRRLRLVMLDACRDNPFVRTMKRTVGSRAVGRGLAAVEPTSVNTFIGFAAKAGSTASDGEGANSPYAIALLNNLATPGLDLRIAFGRVRDEVLKTTRSRQEPFVYGSLGGTNISIVDAPAASNVGAAPQTQAPVPSFDRAAQAWAVTKDTTSIAILESFIEQYGGTPYGRMARARLEELKRSQVAIVVPPVAPVQAPTQSKPTAISLTGRWTWQCKCNDGSAWQGGFDFTQNLDGALSGNFIGHDGSISGKVTSSRVTFTRTFPWSLSPQVTQVWTATLSENAKSMKGSSTGFGGYCSFQASRM